MSCRRDLVPSAELGRGDLETPAEFDRGDLGTSAELDRGDLGTSAELGRGDLQGRRQNSVSLVLARDQLAPRPHQLKLDPAGRHQEWR